ncbi:unnamed protein product [Hyaloperonospora brassicae]|uniref:Uncharacterized protein n=1 Tax=Hyaloperonospora brassicae TaxID=162125 RepID=A0AAV0TWG8_HYABA|nr:unnamed protein product [Hyaloperonospora brassicae]
MRSATLIEIDQSNNEWTQHACAETARGLLANKALKVLYLSNNKCRDEGAVFLAEVLEAGNTTLAYLDMGNNGLTSTGMTPLLKGQSITPLRLFNDKLALDAQKKANLALDVAVNKNAQNEDGSYDLQDQG